MPINPLCACTAVSVVQTASSCRQINLHSHLYLEEMEIMMVRACVAENCSLGLQYSLVSF